MRRRCFKNGTFILELDGWEDFLNWMKQILRKNDKKNALKGKTKEIIKANPPHKNANPLLK